MSGAANAQTAPTVAPTVAPEAAKRVRRRDAPGTEDAILRAAETLFARHGFDAVSTGQLAAAAGVAIGAVYHHFASKEAIYSAATKRAFARKATLPRELMEFQDAPEKALTRLIAWFVGAIIMDENVGLLLKRELLDPRPSTSHLIDEDLFAQPLALCRRLLRELAPQADVDEGIATLLALLFGFTNLKGIHAILPNVRDTLATPEAVSERVTHHLLRGLDA